MFGFTLPGAGRGLALSIPLLVAAAAGCSEGYPPDLAYPARADVLVLKPPTTTPSLPPPPGELEVQIAQVGQLPDAKTFDPKQVPAKARAELKKVLEDVFGSPSAPTVKPLDPDAIATLELGPKTLARGAAHYRRNCLHCHGVPGDGHGPTASWINPHPRDYRQGVFKFISTSNDIPDRKPRRADLLRTLKNGIEGTTMPPFGLLEEKELNQLASYVTHLSLRGEVEFLTLKLYNDMPRDLKGEDRENWKPRFQSPDPNSDDPDTLAGYVELITADLLRKWARCTTEAPIKPGDYPYDATKRAPDDSIERGYEKFIDAKGEAACITCHYDFGRQSLYRYDVWGTLARPANLTEPVYRGGRRPIDVYYRVTGGIGGCGMPQNKTLTAQQAWDVVNFVQALPYPAMLPEKIRERVYVPATVKQAEHVTESRAP